MPPAPPFPPSPPTLLYVIRPSTTTTDTLSSSSTASRGRRRQPVQLIGATGKGDMLLGVPYVRLQHPQHDTPFSILDDAGSQESNSEVEEERLAARTARNSDPSQSTQILSQELVLLSTPSADAYDEHAIYRLQLHFCLLAFLSVGLQCVFLLYHPSQMDPSLVLDSPIVEAGNHTTTGNWTPLPRPFDRISPSVCQAYVPLYAISVVLSMLGVVSAIGQARMGLKVYSLVAFLALLPAVLFAPYLLYVPTLVPTAIMIYLAEELGTRLMPAWLMVPGM